MSEQPPSRAVITQLQHEVDQLKNAYREAVWERSAIFGPPRQNDGSPRIFVLMPFKASLRSVYTKHIKKVASKAKLSVRRADDFFGPGPVMNDVWSAINSARIIVADCTGRNPNVFYEIGLAHAVGKFTILVSQSIEDVPFDLRQLRIILYKRTKAGMLKFESDLLQAISDR